MRNSGNLSRVQILATSAWVALLNFMEKAYLALLCWYHEHGLPMSSLVRLPAAHHRIFIPKK